MIKQGSIRGLGAHVRAYRPGSRLVAASRITADMVTRLVEAGFVEPMDEGQSVLPSSHFGRTAAFNAEGRDVVHRDQPMETVYRHVEWTHDQWNGPYTERVTEVVERPYQRYPRTFIQPPAIELTTRLSATGQLFVCGPVRILGRDDDALVHDVNLVLDVCKECEILSDGLVSQLNGNVRRLNWNVLPQGHYPWDVLQPHVRQAVDRLTEQAKPVIEHRLETVSQYPHQFVAIGNAGFSGYVIFGFPQLGIFVLECTHEGNATYVFGQNWEELSQMSKAEILRGDLQLHRLIHVQGWRHQLARMMRQYGY